MNANKRRAAKKLNPSPDYPAIDPVNADEDEDEMDSDELGLMFLGAMGQDQALQFAEG